MHHLGDLTPRCTRTWHDNQVHLGFRQPKVFPPVGLRMKDQEPSVAKIDCFYCIVLYCLYLYPGFYSYTEGATWKILDLLTETLLI